MKLCASPKEKSMRPEVRPVTATADAPSMLPVFSSICVPPST